MSKIAVSIEGHIYTLEVQPDRASPGLFVVVVDGEEIPVYVAEPADPTKLDWFVVGNRPYELVFARDLSWVQSYAGRHHLEVHDLDAIAGRPVSSGSRVKAPIPGLISNVLVEAGQTVEAGQPLLILEAMKMENEIRAPRSGQIGQLTIKPGQTVVLDELLVEIV